MSRLRVYHNLEEIGPEARPSAVTIGNFDGVHQAHRRIFERVSEIAREHGWKASVLTFDPHPARVVAPGRAPRLLSTLEQRIGWMRESGIEQVFVLPFDKPFSHRSPRDFVEHVLVERLGARAVLVGDNFRFGHRHAGDVRLLERLGRELGFFTEIIPGVMFRGRFVSSSEVRLLLEIGDVSRACRLLGRPYSLEGTVAAGAGRGSRQTVPTLNLQTAAEIIPATGVYITRTVDLDLARRSESVTNVGYRPTFNGKTLTVESHLLEPPGDSPPARIRIEFLRRVREERKFESAEALKAQILADIGRARAYFRRLGSARERTRSRELAERG